MIGFTAVLAVVLAVPTVRADAEFATKDDLQAIQRQLNEIRKKLEDLRTVQDLERAMDSVTFQVFERRLQRLEEAVARMATVTRTTSGFTPDLAGSGTIRLRNRSGYMATIVVNGQPYPVPAYETRLIQGMPAGPFTYEVSANGFGIIQPLVNRTLLANREFTININPPPLVPIPEP
jgi:hypothetical protein